MGRRRFRPQLAPLPGRITCGQLTLWMHNNDLTPKALAEEVFVEPATVQGWMRGTRHCPDKLAKQIDRAATVGALPPWGGRWPNKPKSDPVATSEPSELDPPLAMPARAAIQDCECCGNSLKPDGQCANWSCDSYNTE